MAKMKQEKNLLDKAGRQTGFTVPQGYFEQMRSEVEAKLPPMVKLREQPPLTLWGKIRPYVYMAAMFAGIWCMMKMFHMMGTAGQLNLDNPPEEVAVAMADPVVYDFYLPDLPDSDYELLYEVGSSYDSISEFEEDFGYELDPEYENIKID